MNFWKNLRQLLDEMFPEWQDKFIAYKALKKQLKKNYPKVGNDDDERLSKLSKRPRFDDQESNNKDFLKLLVQEVNKINGFFMDKEEDCVIRLTLLKAEVSEVNDSKEELMRLGRRVVDIHGEMILLNNYSALNYIGLLKILKKYDKRSGDVIRLPFIRNVLQQPFFRTEVINNLVQECEILICHIFSRHEQLQQDAPVGNYPGELAAGTTKTGLMENQYLRLSRSALQTLRQIRSQSSTISMFSLPPMEA